MKLGKAVDEAARGLVILRRGGARAGWRFLREEVLRNGWIRMLAGVGDRRRTRVECNVCGWRGPRFLTHCSVQYVDRNAFCPRCKSYPRHRGFAWLLRNALADELSSLRDVDGMRLVFAPEPGMMKLLGATLSGLEGADLVRRNEHVVHLEDLQTLSFADESVAFVSCFHVLEHVPDDRKALSEMHRVLRRDGRLILCVPMTLGRWETVEFGGPNPLLNDHCFDYGEDFEERLTEAGFSGVGYRLHEVVPRELHERLALSKDVVYVLTRTAVGERPRVVHPDGPRA